MIADHIESHHTQGMAHNCSQVLGILSHMKTCAVHVFTGFSDLKPVFEAEACSSSDMPFLTMLSTTKIYEALPKGDGNSDTNSDLVLLSLKWESLSLVATVFHWRGYSVSWPYPCTDISHWGRLLNTFKLLARAPSHLPISSLQNFTHTWTAAIPSLHCCCAPCQEHGFPQTVEGRAGFKTKRLVSDMTSVLKTDLMTDVCWWARKERAEKSRAGQPN